MHALATIDVMYEDANEKVRIRQRLTNRLQLLRTNKIDPDEYRLAGAIAEDLECYQGGGGGALQAIPGGEGYVAMPRASSRPVAPQERCAEALERIGGAKDALGAPAVWPLIEYWLMRDPTMHAFEKRARKRHGDGLTLIRWALDRIADAQVYDLVKWRVIIRGEGA